MALKTATRRTTILVWTLTGILVSAVLILVRVLPLGGPFVFSDEYTYAAWSSALLHGTQTPPPLAVSVGDWLYLRLYEIVFVGSGSYLVKARVLNAIISALAVGALVPALHASESSRRPQLAVALAVGFVVALLGAYAAYFMPEAPYFACICLWLYFLTKWVEKRNPSIALAAGIVGGIATMTKAHGLLMLPATLLMILLVGLKMKEDWRKAIVSAVLLLVGWFVCTTVISLLFGHDTGINPIGGFYTGLGLDTAEHMGGDPGALIKLALQHVAALVVVVGLPLLLCSWLALVAVFRPLRHGYKAPLQFPALVLGCTLIGMLLVTVVFTVSVAGTGRFETLARLHGRYYEQFAWLAACVGIIGSRSVLIRWPWWTRAMVFIAFVVSLMGSWWVLGDVGWQNPNDFATAYGFFANPHGRLYAMVLSAVAALSALVWPKQAPTILASAMLLWLGYDAVCMEQKRWSTHEQAAGRVAAMVAEQESGNGRATVEVVGPGETVPVFRAAFHLLDKQTRLALGAADNTCGVAGRTPDWVIAVDGASDPCGYLNDVRIGDVSAGRRVGPSTVVSSPNSGVAYHASLALTGPPRVTADGKNILVTVIVTNNGRGTFGSATTPNNVNLGAHSIDASGNIGINDLARGHLPQISSGETKRASILLPVAHTLGYRVELLPVQEDVAWFDQWGTKPLVMGPFQRCNPAAIGKVCDASGKPLPVAAGKRLFP